ncbi:hypothetical protein GF386_02785 [Candidatus Pacearchaeota archaeon]|nr:hypothetical protein [Candidatus Pacearchaeota archaeon]MBD3283074.1 hypothetical protein [Candidatus Pacearchaeota archaeon]
MKNIKTVEDSDKVLEAMFERVEADARLKGVLKSSGDWKSRWRVLEKYILEYLDEFGINQGEYQSFWIRERFFYGMQQRSGQDYGFCAHFTPAFRARTESLLTDNLDLELRNMCGYGGETLETTCNGTSREICVHLNPQLRILRGLKSPEWFGES